MAQYNNSNNNNNNQLESICSVSHVGVNLINVSLVREIRPPNDTKTYKPEYFFFVSCAKGTGTPQQRTYDFQNQFNAKYSIDEVISLSFMLKQFATGNAFAVKNGYAKFCANGKNVSGNVGTYKDKTVFGLYFNDSSNKIAESFSPEVAFAFATRMEKLYNLAIDRETQRAVDNPNTFQNNRRQQMDQAPQANGYPNTYQNPNDFQQNNQYPQQNFQTPQNNGFGQQQPNGFAPAQNNGFSPAPNNGFVPQQQGNPQQPVNNNGFDSMNADFSAMMSNMTM